MPVVCLELLSCTWQDVHIYRRQLKSTLDRCLCCVVNFSPCAFWPMHVRCTKPVHLEHLPLCSPCAFWPMHVRATKPVHLEHLPLCTAARLYLLHTPAPPYCTHNLHFRTSLPLPAADTLCTTQPPTLLHCTLTPALFAPPDSHVREVTPQDPSHFCFCCSSHKGLCRSSVKMLLCPTQL